MKKIQKRYLIIIACIPILFIFYYLSHPNLLLSEPENGHGKSPSVLMVGTNVWPGYEPLYLARELGFYNSIVRLVEFTSTTQVIRAFRNGTIHVAALTLDEVLLLAQDGVEVKVILVTDISHGGDVILSKPEIKTLNDLKGKKVAVENTALGAYVLMRALQLAGMNLSDIEIVHSEASEHTEVFSSGEVDAVVSFDPARSRILNSGANSIFDSTMIPGEIVDVLVVRNDILKTSSDKLGTLFNGWFKALDYLKNRPEHAAKLMTPRMKLSAEDVLASYDGLILPDLDKNKAMLGGAHPELDKLIIKLTEVMLQTDLLFRKPEGGDFTDSALLENVNVEKD